MCATINQPTKEKNHVSKIIQTGARSVSRWTHAMCAGCWVERHGETRQPTVMLEPAMETCCWCGDGTMDGIYVRHDPAEVACAGKGPVHDE